MQPIRSQTRVTPRHGQALAPKKICNVFERRPFHPQPAGKGVPQVLPMKVLELSFSDRIFKSMPRIFERFARLARPKNSSVSITRFEDRFHSCDGSIN
jgi:hypothetical protein